MGTIAEYVIGHSDIVFIEMQSVREGTFSINNISQRNLGISIN